MRTGYLLTIFLLIAAALVMPSAGNPPPSPASSEIQAELSMAFSSRLQAAPATQSLTLNLFKPELDTAFTSPDGKTAVLWLALRDDAGHLLATEPGLALARLSARGWQVLLPGDPGWEETLAALPDGMLPAELSPAPNTITLDPNAITGPLTDYYLPYAAGTSRWLEGSISHFQSIPALGYPSCTAEFCHYAFDFTDSWHFPILASKDGVVVASRDSCSDGNPGCTNYIVLKNSADQAYQIYLHLANGTIPNDLAAGNEVLRGQYLGDSDDTGYSTSQHVHFMVTKSIWVGGDGYYWGNSVDIRFADVSINNGIPRTCYEVTHFPVYDGAVDCLGSKSDPLDPANDWYISGNVGAYPPTGSLTRPAAGAAVAAGSNPLMDITATTADDVRVTAVRLVAKINNEWVEIGPMVTQPAQPDLYDWDMDLCAAAPFNGPLEVALRVWDHEGNVAEALDPRTIQVDHACPPPTSQLNPAEGFDSTAVHLSWDGASAGAGLSSYELQWRTEPGSWNAANTLTFPASKRSAWFVGQLGGAYAFRLRALDADGQAEPWPANDLPETGAIMPAACSPDAFEPDDSPDHARSLTPGVLAEGNLCGPGNPDWFKVQFLDPGDYRVSVPSQNGGAAVNITVYSEDGVTVLASAQAGEVGQAAGLFLRSFAGDSYYIKVEPLVANLVGTNAGYGIGVLEAKEIYLPLLVR